MRYFGKFLRPSPQARYISGNFFFPARASNFLKDFGKCRPAPSDRLRHAGARPSLAAAGPRPSPASGHGVKRSVLRCKHLRLWHEASPLPRQAGGAPPASRSRRTKAHGTSERAPARENLSREQACQTQSRSQSRQESAASRRRSKRSSHEMARFPEREVTRAQEAAQVHSTRHPNVGEK